MTWREQFRKALQTPQTIGKDEGARTALWKRFHSLAGLPVPEEDPDRGGPEVLSDTPGSPLQAFTPLVKSTISALAKTRRGLMTLGGKFTNIENESHPTVFERLFNPSGKVDGPSLFGRIRDGSIARFGDAIVEADVSILLSPKGQDLLLSRAQRALQKGEPVRVDVLKDRRFVGPLQLYPQEVIGVGGDLTKLPDRAVQETLRGTPQRPAPLPLTRR